MSKPSIFLSAATLDLKEWRDVLDSAFSRAGFNVIVQDRSLAAAPGDVRALLARHIAESDCVIHLAGLGYGAHAAKPFPEAPEFQCSWTQFEYYYAHQLGKDVFAFVCAPSLSAANFQEKGETTETALKTVLQQQHRNRVATGHFDGTPLEGNKTRTLNEAVDSQAALLKAVAATIGTLHRTDPAYDRVKEELSSLGSKVDSIAANQKSGARFSKVALALTAFGLLALGAGGILAFRNLGKKTAALTSIASETSRQVETTLHDPIVLKARLEKEIRVKADALIVAKKAAKAKWSEIAEIERQRDRQIEQLGKLITTIGSNLGPDANPIYLEAVRVLENEGIGEAIRYLQSQQPGLLEEDAAKHRAKTEDEGRFQKERESALQPLLLQASLLTTQLRYEEALVALQRLVRSPTGEKWWAARNHLGILYHTLARWSDAEVEWRAAEKLTENPADSAIVINNLAQLLQATNRLVDAESLMRRALEIDEASYKKDHAEFATDVARDLSNLALLLQATNRHAEAEPLLRRALELNEGSSLKDNPDVATDLNNLALLLQATNRLEEAEPLMRRALEIDEAIYGKDHPTVARDLNNLALLLHYSNRLDEVEPLVRRALEIDEASFGKDHPDVARVLNNLAQVLQARDRLEEAEPLMRRSLEIDEASYGKDHPAVARDLNNLALLLNATHRLKEAEPLMRRSVLILLRFERQNQHTHFDFATTFANFVTLVSKGTLNPGSGAEPLKTVGLEAGWNQETWATRLEALAASSPEMSLAGAVAKRAGARQKEGDFAQASNLWAQAIALNRQEPAINPLDVRIARINRAAVRLELGETDSARDDLMALIREMDTEGIHSATTALAHHHLARCLLKRDQKTQALAHLREALAIYAALDPKEVPEDQIGQTRKLVEGLE